jgi:hypothetical protein
MNSNLTSGCTPTKTNRRDTTCFVSTAQSATSVNDRAASYANAGIHATAEAIDLCLFANSKFAAADMYEFIYKNLPFDRLIWKHGTDSEPQWVHVSLKKTGNRRQTLKAYKVGNVTKYKQITELNN